MGEELCRDEGWNNACVYYTRKTFEAMMILCVIPRWLRPYIHWILPQCREVRRALIAARKELDPHIERHQRVKAETLARGEKSPFDDAIEWFDQGGSALPPADCQPFASQRDGQYQKVCHLVRQRYCVMQLHNATMVSSYFRWQFNCFSINCDRTILPSKTH